MLGALLKRARGLRPSPTLQVEIKSVTGPEATPHWSSWTRTREAGQSWWNTKTAINEGLCQSPIVNAATRKRAELVSSVPWIVYLRGADGEMTEAPTNHPLNVALRNPNKNRSFKELIYEAEMNLCMDGNAYISKIRMGSPELPRNFWLLPSKDMWAKPGAQMSYVDFYELRNHGLYNKRIESDDMIHLRMPNPDDPIYGMPILMAAAKATDVDREISNWQKNSLENRVASDVHIEVPEGTTPEQIKQVKEQIQERNGSAANARNPFITSGKVNWLGQTAVELDLVDSEKANWLKIAAVFGVPLSTLGFTEDVNLSNAKEMDKQLWTHTIIPQLELYKCQFNNQLAPDFGDNVYLDFDLSNVEALQVDEGARLDRADKLFRMGVPFNTINQHLELGFDDIEGGNIGYLPSGLIPASWGNEQPMPEDEKSFGELMKKSHEVAYGRK